MDIEYLLWLQGIRESLSPFIEMLMNVITHLGGNICLAVVPCVIYWTLDKELGMFALVNVCIGGNINQTVKDTACVYRPWIRDPRVVPSPAALDGATGYSFPSGHTQSAGCVYGATAWKLRKRRRAVSIFLVVITLLVAFSRNFLGVHAPQDVLVALAETALSIWLSQLVIAWVRRETTKDTTVLAIGIAVAVVLMAYTALKPYPMDYVDGVLLVDPTKMKLDAFSCAGILAGVTAGWFLEHRYVRFSTDCSAGRKAVRFAICLAVVGIFFGMAQLIKLALGRGMVYATAKGLFPAFSGVFIGPAVSAPLERRFAPSDTENPRGSR